MPPKPFRLAVRAAICDEQQRCLLIRRSSACKHFVGTWEWPGGKVDAGETFDAALRREVREETGLEIELMSVVGAIGFGMADAQVALLCMQARLAGGTVTLSEEHDMHSWVPVAVAPTWDLTEGLKPLAEILASTACGKGRG